MCGMIAVQAQIIWGANLIPLGAACGGDDRRRKPACSRMPTKCVRLGRRHARDARAGGVGSCGVDVRPPSDSKNCKQKARNGLLRAGSAIFRDDGLVPVILPGVSNRFQAVNKWRKIRRNGFDKLKPISPIVCEWKSPRPFPARALRYR